MDSSAVQDKNFWGFMIPVIIIIVLALICAFVAYAYRGWHKPSYGPDSVSWGAIAFIIWAILLLLYAYGAYLTDKAAPLATQRNIIRTLYGFSLVFIILAFICYAFFHHIPAAMGSLLFAFILIIGMELYYPQFSTTGAALLFPTFVMVVLALMGSGFLFGANPHDKAVRMYSM